MICRPLSGWTHAASRKLRSVRRKRKESDSVAQVAEEEEKLDQTGKVQDVEKGKQ